MEIPDPQYARTRDGAYIAFQVVGDGPARTDAPPRLGARMVGVARQYAEEREMTRTIKEAAPRPLAADTLVAEHGGWRDPWVES